MLARACRSACRLWRTRSAPAVPCWRPLLRRVEAHVFAAERLHGDDTVMPVLATGKTDTGRCWVYVRDESTPFGGSEPPAAMFYYSRESRWRTSRPAPRRLRRYPAGRRL